MRFAVWGPRAGRIELVLGGDRFAMDAAGDGSGWWSVEAVAAPGDRYAFAVDGGPPRFDPRAVDLPEGIEGPAAVYDHGAFAWTDDGWEGLDLRRSPVLYELHVGTFSESGTFDGVVEHLDHLVDLGVDAIELLPVATASGDRGWGYDGAALFAPHHAYGGPDGLKRLVDACHRAGIAVLLDVVHNHLGPVGNHLAELGPYFTDRHRTAWGDGIDVDGPDSTEVRRFVVDNARSWIADFHLDGLRLDAVHAIVDSSPRHVLADVAEAVHEAGRAAGRCTAVIAESESHAAELLALGVDGVWADDWHHALHTLLTGERDGYYAGYGAPEQLADAVERGWIRDGASKGTHPSSFVIATQTHDQIGNRACGDRLAALVAWPHLFDAVALLLTSPCTPMLFQGEEWGASTPFQYFTDHRDPDLAGAVRDGRRAEFEAFGWEPEQVPDPQDPATFRRSKLDWSERDRSPHAELLAWYRHLIARRRSHPDLRDPLVPARASWDGARLRVHRGAAQIEVDLGDTTTPRTPESVLRAP